MKKRTKTDEKSGTEVPAKTSGRGLTRQPEEHFMLKLYVSGMTPRSQHAIDIIQKLCEKHLAGRYNLAIVDLYQQPTLAIEDQIIAAPTLIKNLPLPVRRVIGDMSDTGRILEALGVEALKDERG
jgi:circadian clock protein KaiB